MSQSIRSWSKMTKTIINGIFVCLVAISMATVLSCSGSGSKQAGASSGSGSKSSELTAAIKKLNDARVRFDVETYYQCFDANWSKQELEIYYPSTQKEWEANPCTRYEIVSEQIADNGNTASVTIKVFYKDGPFATEKWTWVYTDSGWKAKLGL